MIAVGHGNTLLYIISVLGRLRQEDDKFKTTLGNLARLPQNKIKRAWGYSSMLEPLSCVRDWVQSPLLEIKRKEESKRGRDRRKEEKKHWWS